MGQSRPKCFVSVRRLLARPCLLRMLPSSKDTTVAFLGWSMWDSVASLKRRISVHVAVLRECMQRMLYHRLYECKLYSVGKVSDLLLYDIIRLIVGRLLT